MLQLPQFFFELSFFTLIAASRSMNPPDAIYPSQEAMRQTIMGCGRVGIVYGLQHRRCER